MSGSFVFLVDLNKQLVGMLNMSGSFAFLTRFSTSLLSVSDSFAFFKCVVTFVLVGHFVPFFLLKRRIYSCRTRCLPSSFSNDEFLQFALKLNLVVLHCWV